MPVLTVFSTLSDRFVWVASAINWPDAYGAAVGIVSAGLREDLYASFRAGPSWNCHRGFLFFDTSLLPLGAIVTSAVLSLYMIPAMDTEDDPGYATLHVVRGVQNDPVIPADFDAHVGMVVSGGSILHVAMVINAYNDIVLNANGISWLNPGGMTKFCCRLAGDLNNWVPPSMNDISFSAGDGPLVQRPRLTVTYLGAPLTISRAYALGREEL